VERRGLARPDRVVELGGGVSNVVLLMESGPERFVLKQALAKLRVEQDWFCDPGRVFRESAAMRCLAGVLHVPEVLFEDRENGCFAMSAAPPEAETWKAELMRGEVRITVARRIGEMLAAMVRASRNRSDWAAQFGDQTVFDGLRLDPYYRSTARVHADLAARIGLVMERSAARRTSLVHGDWSPKNFLVWGETVMAIDWEVIHFGDAAFDAAFLVNHLALKSVARQGEYREAAMEFIGQVPELESAAMEHLGPLMLARVDGKSPVEYLDKSAQEQVRAVARGLILDPPRGVAEVFERL
jgi:5-methylthioribose kinase